MRIGINTNQSGPGGRPITVDEMIEQVAGIGRGGFAYATFAHISSIDALTAIAVTGRVVPRVELTTSVLPIYLWHPVLMVQQALTTQARVRWSPHVGHRPVPQAGRRASLGHSVSQAS